MYSSYNRTIQPKTAIQMNNSLIIAYFTLNCAYLLQLVNKNKVRINFKRLIFWHCFMADISLMPIVSG